MPYLYHANTDLLAVLTQLEKKTELAELLARALKHKHEEAVAFAAGVLVLAEMMAGCSQELRGLLDTMLMVFPTGTGADHYLPS